MSFTSADADAPAVERTVISDPISAALGEFVREILWLGQASSARSLQVQIGFSEIGASCERQLGYKAAATPPVNFPDPLKVTLGTEGHTRMADLIARLNGSGRFLIEVPVSYRGVPGTIDLYDQLRKTVFDWKTTSKSKIRGIRFDGPSSDYKTQIQGYGTALASVGYPVERVAIVFLPRDGDLTDLYVWSAPLDTTVIDKAIDRYERISTIAPADLTAMPTRLCPWCDHFMPNSTDLARGCPGNSENTNRKG